MVGFGGVHVGNDDDEMNEAQSRRWKGRKGVKGQLASHSHLESDLFLEIMLTNTCFCSPYYTQARLGQRCRFSPSDCLVRRLSGARRWVTVGLINQGFHILRSIEYSISSSFTISSLTWPVQISHVHGIRGGTSIWSTSTTFNRFVDLATFLSVTSMQRGYED
jgi:hypothetical protein